MFVALSLGRTACRAFSLHTRRALVNRLVYYDSPAPAVRSISTVRLADSSVDDASAWSRSRAPFSMPKNAADDSKPTSSNNLAWNQLGLWTELIEALQEQDLLAPTPVQQLVIPQLLAHDKQSLAFLAATGSGKTLAYCLPLLQHIKQSEVFAEEESRPMRPRLLILAPTRELAAQILSVVKSLSHVIKLSSCAVVGGADYGIQRKQLERPIDVVVATPGRLLKHWKAGHVFLGKRLKAIVVDEMDTMVEQGFAGDLRQLLYPILYHKQAEQEILPGDFDAATAPRVVLTSATLTQAIQKMIGDDKLVKARQHHHKETEQPKLILPKMAVIKAPGLHKSVPRLKQVFVDIGGADKLSLLIDVLKSGGRGAAVGVDEIYVASKTMVFCNTAASCRAVEYALAEAGISAISYHGELNSAARAENLALFRKADQAAVLVCTDLAARGLDVPEVDHVVMFDFPLNALDYLHRSGRTARGVGRDRTGHGRVTALVGKRDKVLANAIEQAVVKGEQLDGLSSRKSDYLPGGRLNSRPSGKMTSRDGSPRRRVGPVAKKPKARRSTANNKKNAKR